VITAVYLYGAWHGKWEFGPWHLAACVLLDVYWISNIYGLAMGGEAKPLIDMHYEG